MGRGHVGYSDAARALRIRLLYSAVRIVVSYSIDAAVIRPPRAMKTTASRL
jgi:hypothetical protein